ncbi:1,2-dihydroxy-3-keto-5-methylthiopentene dioxygenase [Russula aff. rugulosa BPL654]|nr:1,2-dihydroxy-3-keto-5-methylthiopentene dioxygenase [Russula aff. rugulosa BPL654]
MRAYYFDNLPGDQRLPHETERSVDIAELRKIGVLHWTVPLDQETPGGWESEIDRIAEQQGYKNRDTINVTKEGLGDLYETKLKSSLRNHPSDEWIRIHVLPGDLLVLPAGIYHRFTLDELNKIKALRLFKEEPKWIPYARSPETDSNVYRTEYISSLQAPTVV